MVDNELSIQARIKDLENINKKISKSIYVLKDRAITFNNFDSLKDAVGVLSLLSGIGSAKISRDSSGLYSITCVSSNETCFWSFLKVFFDLFPGLPILESIVVNKAAEHENIESNFCFRLYETSIPFQQKEERFSENFEVSSLGLLSKNRNSRESRFLEVYGISHGKEPKVCIDGEWFIKDEEKDGIRVIDVERNCATLIIESKTIKAKVGQRIKIED